MEVNIEFIVRNLNNLILIWKELNILWEIFISQKMNNLFPEKVLHSSTWINESVLLVLIKY